MTPYEPEQRITISRQGAKPVPGHVVRDDGGKRLMVFDEALRENRVVLRECVSPEPIGVSTDPDVRRSVLALLPRPPGSTPVVIH